MAIGISRGEQPVYGNPSFMRLFGFKGVEALASLSVTDLIAPSAPVAIPSVRQSFGQGIGGGLQASIIGDLSQFARIERDQRAEASRCDLEP